MSVFCSIILSHKLQIVSCIEIANGTGTMSRKGKCLVRNLYRVKNTQSPNKCHVPFVPATLVVIERLIDGLQSLMSKSSTPALAELTGQSSHRSELRRDRAGFGLVEKK